MNWIDRELGEFRDRHLQLSGPDFKRADPCGFCDSKSGQMLSKADFWDLAEVDLVRCKECGLIQVDPMLRREAVSHGCLALYRHQHLGETDRSRRRGLYRAFRHGVAFGTKLKLAGVVPTSVLEVGAGDGMFLKGVQYVFPQAQYTCLDLVREILDALKDEHGFNTIESSLEDVDPLTMGQFDLIVARDILEHVAKPGLVIDKLARMVSVGGHLYFITPNGWQDAWQMFSRWRADHKRSELLINHVNYFDPVSLKARLEGLNFELKDWFVYNLKTFLRGAGWKVIDQHKARLSSRRSATEVIAKTKDLALTFKLATESAIPSFYRWKFFKPFLMGYCWYKHTPLLRVDPSARVGEEIYCFAQRKV